MKLIGKIVHGRGVGTSFGVPTANLEVSSPLPERGVYSARFTVGGKSYPSVVNVGNCPTFSVDKETVEAHIIGLNDDIYGESAEIELIERIRGIIKFPSENELRSQIEKDIKYTLSRYS